ncbi:unnamed protein product [Mytilus coruscus]|uniref:Uncharacterized protein n=1 Tax=Mytilus coruscus TaxID=42192 RepID=A0A6J8ARK5_MYTCO|nr:unnamed protein product [Mytilus coruscus]
MRTTDYATEDDNNGGTTVDSVALREDTTRWMYMKYDLVLSAAAEEEACGIAIYIEYNISNKLAEKIIPVECTKGTAGSTVDKPSIQIDCSHSNMQTTQQMTEAAIQAKNVSGRTVSKHCETLCKHRKKFYCIDTGFELSYLAITVDDRCISRNSNENKYERQIQPDSECTDYDSDGLKYNTLYNASEQQDIMEGDYHTVDLERKQNRSGIHTFDGDYSAVDGNYSSVDIVNMPVKDGSKTDNKIKSTSTSTPKSEI